MSDKKFVRRKKTKVDTSCDESSLVVVDLNKLDNVSDAKSVSGSLIAVNADKEEILKKITETDNLDELKNLTNLFEISLAKKEIARTSKESDLLDKLIDTAGERIENSDYLTNEEILNYLRTFQSNVDKSKKNLTGDITDATSKVSNTINEVNINFNSDNGMSRESREKVLSVVDMILKASNNSIIIDDENKGE